MDQLISSSSVESIKEALSPVAVALGKGAEYSWAVLIKQQYVIAIGDILWGCGILIVAGILTWAIIRAWKWLLSKDGDGDLGVFIIFLTGLVAGVYVVSGSYFYDAAAHYINPDYYAIQTVIDLVHPQQNN